MGARVDRWLARPSALPIWRQLAWSAQRPARPVYRAFSTASAKGTAPPLSIRRLNHTAEEALALSTKEMSLHMSLRAGVPFLRAEEGQTSSLGDDMSFEALRYQADVAGDDKRGNLLVDHEEHRHNLRLWIELLHFRQRLDGLAGVVAIWQGMSMRHVELPTEGEEAHILWTTFVHALIGEKEWGRRESALYDLYVHALGVKQRTGRHYEKLYDIIIGTFFRIRSSYAKRWHAMLSEPGLTPPDALRRVARDAVQSLDSMAFQHFKELYLKRNERDLYDVCLDAALASDDQAANPALTWHRFLIKNGDAPSQDMFLKPQVQRLFQLDKNRSLPMVHAKKTMQDDFSTASRISQVPAMTRASMSSLVGDVHGIKPKEISDAFVAKMLATRAFSLDLVIRGLSFFAVNKLGPVAVREMAVRAGSPIEFCNQLHKLRAMDIDLSDAVYCRLVRNLAEGGHVELFQALLASDQHPEAYGDIETQEALLVSFLDTGKLTQAHITLLCLSLAGVHCQAEAWNLVVQHYLRLRQHLQAAQTIEHLQSQKAHLSSMTLTYLHRYLLPIRRPRMRPIESQRQDRPPFDALDFVTNACMYADDVARRENRPELHVRLRVWRELLKRYGMTHRWPEFTKLVLWLTKRYSDPRFQLRPENFDSGVVQLPPSCPLHFIFDKQMQQAVFTWGFRAAAVRHELRHELEPRTRPVSPDLPDSKDHGGPGRNSSTDPWAQGLALLLHLRSRGVCVSNVGVRHAFRLRMWILFGPGNSTRAFNEINRRVNQLSLAHYIRTLNDIWPGRLVKISSMLLEDAALEPQLLFAFFGSRMLVGRNKASEEYVDVHSWAQAISSGQWSDASRGRTAGQRHWTWARSAFRFTVPKGERKILGSR